MLITVFEEFLKSLLLHLWHSDEMPSKLSQLFSRLLSEVLCAIFASLSTKVDPQEAFFSTFDYEWECEFTNKVPCVFTLPLNHLLT